MAQPLPDRSHVLTEQRNPRTMGLHALSAAECVRVIGEEDRQVLAAMEGARAALTALVEDAEPGFLRGGRVVYLGAGTSGRLGVLDASEAPPTFQVPSDRIIGIIAGGDSSLRRSSEGKEDDPAGAAAELDALRLTGDDVVLGIAAGGTTPYVLGGLEHAKQGESHAEAQRRREDRGKGEGRVRPLTGLLVCSPMARPSFVDHLIVLETGPEVLTGSTRMKAGTATKLALNTISTTLMIRSGRVYENLMVDLRASNDKLRDRAGRIVATLTGLSREESLALLERAGGEVKTAVVMSERGVGREEARGMLEKAGGRLDGALI